MRPSDIERGNGPEHHEERAPGESQQRARPNGADAYEPRPPAFSDESLALRFAERHAGDLRFVAAWNRWLSWTGMHWRVDDTLGAYDLVRHVCRDAAAACNRPKIAGSIASAKTVAAVERLAKADRRLAATVEQWDSDPWLLNTPGGVIDLRTGDMRQHRHDDYCTKITAVAPGGDCPRFDLFLDEITGADADLASYILRVLGYALTGETREHALFFGYGTGRNGKTALLRTAAHVLGDYHRTAPIESFTATNVDRHPTDLAGLRGARLVTATETEQGRRWAESRIKALTGGDLVAARFMRQDFFEYRPQFKLFIAGNHKPSLRSVDEAIRRRFHLIPFAVTIPAEDVDAELCDKLEIEAGGILSRLIAGCLEWQRDGLKPPQAVLDATAAYLEAEDAIAAWIDEKCQRDPQAWEQSSLLFASWSAWAEKAGETAGSMKCLSQALESRGFPRHRKGCGVGFYGLRLNVEAPDQLWYER